MEGPLTICQALQLKVQLLARYADSGVAYPPPLVHDCLLSCPVGSYQFEMSTYLFPDRVTCPEVFSMMTCSEYCHYSLHIMQRIILFLGSINATIALKIAVINM